MSAEIDKLRKLSENKKCFDCNELGTTYIVMDYGIFVCPGCSGIHREFSNKVKGITMSNFNEKEVDFAKKHGNKAAFTELMGGWSKSLFPIPPKTEMSKFKEFMRMKYQ